MSAPNWYEYQPGGPGGPLPASPWHSVMPPAPGPLNSGYNGAPALPTGWGDFTGAQVSRPTEAQLQGGHAAMSMPNPATQTGYGAPAAPPGPTGYGPAQSGGGMTPGSPGYTGYLYAQDPGLWARGYAQRHGVDPNISTPFGDFLLDWFQKLAQPIFKMETGNPDKPAYDTLANPDAILDSLLYGGQGTAFGNISRYAQQNLEKMKPDLGPGGMSYGGAMEYLNAIDTLGSLGMNKYQQNARDRRFQNTIDTYAGQDLANRAAGRPTTQTLWDYIMATVPQMFSFGR